MTKKNMMDKLGIINIKKIYKNLSAARLIEMAIDRGEGILTSNGALNVNTGKYTGRSPLDRFIVDTPENHDTIFWGKSNQPMDEETFWRIHYRLTAYLEDRDLFVFNGYCGADPEYRVPITVINQYAWQNLFARQMFVRPTAEELRSHEEEFTILCVPGFNAFTEIDKTRSEAFVIINLEKNIAIIGGTRYAGEIKKSMFTVMNYLMPERQVFPMHCSANIDSENRTTLFFGLSGTGKTTLSADPDSRLIGDDEHGWSEAGVFNFEGGCYAKCIGLSEAKEPQVWNAVRFGTVLENVVMDMDTRQLDFDSDIFTENSRAAYPVDFIPGAVQPSVGGHPETVIFLTADAFGVMPPVAILTPEQAMYHFLSGYTSKLAGTERGITEPQATFSTGFGEPFLPRDPMIYAGMLGDKIRRHQSSVYLINTGWTGGPYGVGNRMKLAYTRAMVKAAINGTLKQGETVMDPAFGFLIPKHCPGVPDSVLNPRDTWSDAAEYDRAAAELAKRFRNNFKKFDRVGDGIVAAGPIIQL